MCRVKLGGMMCDQRMPLFFEFAPGPCAGGTSGLPALLLDILAEVHDRGALFGNELLNGRAASGT